MMAEEPHCHADDERFTKRSLDFSIHVRVPCCRLGPSMCRLSRLNSLVYAWCMLDENVMGGSKLTKAFEARVGGRSLQTN